MLIAARLLKSASHLKGAFVPFRHLGDCVDHSYRHLGSVGTRLLLADLGDRWHGHPALFMALGSYGPSSGPPSEERIQTEMKRCSRRLPTTALLAAATPCMSHACEIITILFELRVDSAFRKIAVPVPGRATLGFAAAAATNEEVRKVANQQGQVLRHRKGFRLSHATDDGEAYSFMPARFLPGRSVDAGLKGSIWNC